MRRFFPILLIFTAWACGGDEPTRPPDTPAPPVLTSISLAPDSTLADTVAIAVAAERADRAVLLVDDVEAAADTLAPFILPWNTRTAANGPHRLTVLAVNEGGFADSTFGCVVNNPGGGVVVMVEPAALTLASGDTARFETEVLGTANPAVAWSLGSEEVPEEAGFRRTARRGLAAAAASPFAAPAASALGHVDSTGLYTAPAVAPEGLRILVVARSAVDPAARDTARVTVTQGPAVAITSAPAEVILGRTYPLEATVYGMEDSTVTWSVVEGAGHGTIDADGLYTAPDLLPDPPRVTFRAAVGADSALTDTLSAAVIEPILVAVSPPAPTVSEEGRLLFAASLENAAEPGVIWIVEEGRRHGTITQAGLYTAPDRLPDPPAATVTAISAEDNRFRGSAAVELVAGPPPGEGALLGGMFTAGIDAARLSEQLTGMVGTALDLLRELSGDPNRTGGSLRGSGEFWYFTDDRTDTLRVEPETGPVWLIRFTAAGGAMDPPVDGEYAGGMFFRGHLDCTVTIEGRSFHLTNLSWVPSGAPAGEGRWATQFQRSLEGSVPDGDGGFREVSYQHNGVSEWSEETSRHDFTVTGAVRNPDGLSVTLSEIVSVGHVCSCPGLDAFEGRELRGTISAEMGDDTYTWENLAASTYYRVDEVIRSDEWRGEGLVRKNGAEYGRVELAVPLPWGIGEHPRPILEYAHGHQLLLLVPPVDGGTWLAPPLFRD